MTACTFWVDGVQVSEADYVAAERAAGFRNTLGRPDEPATSAWKGRGVDGTMHSGRMGFMSTRWDTASTEHHQ